MFNYEILKSFNDMEMLVYDYIVKNKNVVKYMTVRELADEVHVSTATVMRFCRKAGFDGYSEFKVKFKMYLEEETKKNKKNDPDRLEMNKYCKFCRKHTLHKETK